MVEVLYQRKVKNYCFKRLQNPRMNKADIQNKQMTKIQHQITMSKEDKQFKNVMNHIKDLVRFQ